MNFSWTTDKQMDNFARDVDFQTQDIAYSRVDKLTSGAGDVIRICFLSGTLRQGFRHFDPSKKIFFRCISYNGVIAPCCKGSVIPAEQRFIGLVFKYNVADTDGSIDESKCQGTILAWDMTERIFRELGPLARQYAVLNKGFLEPQTDLILRIRKAKFADFITIPIRSCHLKKNKAWYDLIMARAAKINTDQILGRVMSPAEIEHLLGMTVTPMVNDTRSHGDINLDDIVENALGSRSPGAAESQNATTLACAAAPKPQMTEEELAARYGPLAPSTDDPIESLALSAASGFGGPVHGDWADKKREALNKDINLDDILQEPTVTRIGDDFEPVTEPRERQMSIATFLNPELKNKDFSNDIQLEPTKDGIKVTGAGVIELD